MGVIITKIRKATAGLVILGLLLGMAVFCHFFNLANHSEVARNLERAASTFSEKSVACCSFQSPPQVFLARLSVVQPAYNGFSVKILSGLIFLLSLVAGLSVVGLKKHSSRSRHYRDRVLFYLSSNHILRLLSQGILQPKLFTPGI